MPQCVAAVLFVASRSSQGVFKNFRHGSAHTSMIRVQLRTYTDDNLYLFCHNIRVIRNIPFPQYSQGVIKMSSSAIIVQNSRVKFGWIILLVSAALMTLMHFSLIFFLDEPVLFTGFAVFNLYALIVILIPFRRGKKWAWMATWLLPIGLALPAALDPAIAIYYYAVAGVCVLGLLLTMRDFFSKK
jgi:hypothetical protein